MSIVIFIMALGFVAGLALLFGFIANRLFRTASPNRRAAIAAIAVAVLLTIPAYVALLGAGAPLVSIVAIMVGTLIMAAMCFPVALAMTRRQPGPADPETFD